MTSTRIQTFTVEGPVLELYVSDCASWTDPKLSDYRRHLTAGASR